MKVHYIRKQHLLIFSFLLLSFTQSFGQYTVEGQVHDTDNRPLIGASILLSDTSAGTVTDVNGKFSITTKDNANAELVVSYIGFEKRSITVSATGGPYEIEMVTTSLFENEVVISASLYAEGLLNAPVTIQKIKAYQIQSTASGDFFRGLGNMKEIHVLNNGINFKVFNVRGFNSSSPFRTVFFVDGMDIQSPSLNFAPGNMLGISDIDLESIEVISGPSSALYGPNAFQGVLSMQSKDPYSHEGVSVKVKGGSRDYFDGQFRYAQAYGKNKRLAIKVVGSYMRAKDWMADNFYLPIPTAPQDLNTQVEALDNTGDENYGDFNTYAASDPTVRPNVIPPGTQFILPGYAESDLYDGNVNSIKASAGLYYKLTDKTQIAYTYRFGNGGGVFQGSSRSRLKNFRLQQHRLEVKDKRFSVKAYATFEDMVDTYDLTLTGVNIGFAGLSAARESYLSSYVHAIDSLSNGFSQAVSAEDIDHARSLAQLAAAEAYIDPGTDLFNQVFESVIANPDKPLGSRFVGRSNLQHVEGQYNFLWDFMTMNVGASWRRWGPVSDGKIFADTVQVNGEVNDISYMEFGGFVQLSTDFFKKKLKVIASARVDKSQNFRVQFSPRLAISYAAGNHHFRISGQSAFRNPTLQNQYFLLNLGALTSRGNVSGYDNLYTQESVDAYRATPVADRDPSSLEAIEIAPIKPEGVKTLEFGYRSVLAGKLMFDLSAYYNAYSNFIGSVAAVEPNDGIAGDSTGEADVVSRNYVSYDIAANSKTNVNTMGVSLAAKYAIGKGIFAYGNYTYTKLFQPDNSDGLIPAFNTPEHKINIGFEGRRVYKGLGFAVNFQWVDGYTWETAYTNRVKAIFGLLETNVPSYHTLDVQVSYEIEKIHSTLRLGASNIYNNKHIEIWGGPKIGAFVYGSWTFDFGL